MKHKGTKTLKTERLVLRKIKTSDYKDVFRYASKEEVSKYVTWDKHTDPKITKKLCRHWKNQYVHKSTYRWAIEYNKRVIGCIDVVVLYEQKAVLGWCIDSEFWNKGIVTEAAAAVRDYLLNYVGFEAIEAAHIKENVGSGRVMQKIGMKQIPYEETVYYKTGKNLDANILDFYSISK